MSQVRTRKRPAPGTSPIETAPIQLSTSQNNTRTEHTNATDSMSANQYLQWPEQGQPTYPDPSASYGSTSYDGISNPASGQVARRSAGQQMVSRNNDGNNETWPVLADGAGLTSKRSLLNEDDDDLDRRAELAKRETQAKRKQIPPFVQKLSR